VSPLGNMPKQQQKQKKTPDPIGKNSMFEKNNVIISLQEIYV
jgi:hypothetical protein